jgi:hypothetical protein
MDVGKAQPRSRRSATRAGTRPSRSSRYAPRRLQGKTSPQPVSWLMVPGRDEGISRSGFLVLSKK